MAICLGTEHLYPCSGENGIKALLLQCIHILPFTAGKMGESFRNEVGHKGKKLCYVCSGLARWQSLKNERPP